LTSRRFQSAIQVSAKIIIEVFLALLDGTIAAFDDTTLDRRFVKARLGDPRFQIVGEDLQLTPPKNPKAHRRWGCSGGATLRGDQGPELEASESVTGCVMAYRRGNDMILLGCVGVSADGQ
jgi:hypothetical protein